MAIGNVTPDSFYAGSRITSVAEVLAWASQSLSDGAAILDIGGCSTRPGSQPPETEEEWARLEPALIALKKSFPEATLSLDTYRPEIARRALESFGPMIINDVSGGCTEMYNLVRSHGVPYIWTLRGDYGLPERMADQMAGVELILDPGIGFTGGIERDYDCMRRLSYLQRYGCSILIGVSRKSMLYKPLGLTPEESLAPTQVLHLYALQQGASILRVHDVRAAMETIDIYKRIC